MHILFHCTFLFLLSPVMVIFVSMPTRLPKLIFSTVSVSAHAWWNLSYFLISSAFSLSNFWIRNFSLASQNSLLITKCHMTLFCFMATTSSIRRSGYRPMRKDFGWIWQNNQSDHWQQLYGELHLCPVGNLSQVISPFINMVCFIVSKYCKHTSHT